MHSPVVVASLLPQTVRDYFRKVSGTVHAAGVKSNFAKDCSGGRRWVVAMLWIVILAGVGFSIGDGQYVFAALALSGAVFAFLMSARFQIAEVLAGRWQSYRCQLSWLLVPATPIAASYTPISDSPPPRS